MSHVRRVATPDPWNRHNEKEEFQGSGKRTNIITEQSSSYSNDIYKSSLVIESSIRHAADC